MREKEKQPDTDTLTQEDTREKQTEKTEQEIKFELQETWKSIQKKIADEKITDKIEKIQCAFDYLILDVMKWHNFHIRNYQFTGNEIKIMCNTVVFYVLLVWLENDKKSRQTMASFAKQPYTPVPEQKRRVLDRNKETASRLRYYEKLYRENLVLHGQQAEREGFKHKRPSYKKEYDFIALRFMEMLAENHLAIYKLLFLRKKFMRRTTSGADDGLIEAFKNYGELIHELNRCTSEKEFVIGCLQLIKFENAYRVALAGEIAECMVNAGLSPEMQFPPILKACYHRLPPNMLLFPSNLQTTCIGGYSIVEDALKRKVIPIALEKILAMRVVVEEVAFLISTGFPVKKFGMWTEADYKRAAQFLTDEFCVLQIFDDFAFDRLNTQDTAFCECVRKLYSNNSFMDQNAARVGRETLKRKLQKRNK